MSDITVKQAKVEDAAGIAEIHVEGWQSAYRGQIPDAYLNSLEVESILVIVPWSEKPISAITTLYVLNDHEILHQGWNLAIMDHLNIERFPELKDMWG